MCATPSRSESPSRSSVVSTTTPNLMTATMESGTQESLTLLPFVCVKKSERFEFMNDHVIGSTVLENMIHEWVKAVNEGDTLGAAVYEGGMIPILQSYGAKSPETAYRYLGLKYFARDGKDGPEVVCQVNREK